MKTLGVVGLAALALCAPARAQRPQCAHGATPCEAYANADAIFVGSVTGITPETTNMEEGISGRYDQTARVSVEKVYKGRAGRSIVLRQLGRRTTQKFIAGSRYLFYAHYVPRLKIWEVRECGRTIMAAYAHDDLRYLNGLPGGLNRTRIAGRVLRFETDEERPQGMIDSLPGIRLRIAGAGGEFEVLTGAGGAYELFDAPPGRYTVQPRIPSGLIFYGAIHYGPDPVARAKSLDIELPRGGCSGVEILLTPGKGLKKDGGDRIGKTAAQTLRRARL